MAAGLDAVISTILDTLPRRDRWCVEFGAWDGSLASNSQHLILQHGYSAVLIEGDEQKFRDLQRNYSAHKGVLAVNQYVGFDAETGLDSILAKTPIPHDFDFLSIDIDGNDYHAWNAVGHYRPKAVCIEFNVTIPPEVSFVQPGDASINQGASLAALIELGNSKGYELIAVIGVNAFFVLRGYYSLFRIQDNGIYALWTNRDQITYIFSGYDGQVFLRGCRRLPWLELPMSESKAQQVPSYLRQFPHSRTRRLIYVSLMDPLSLIPKMARLVTKYMRRWKTSR